MLTVFVRELKKLDNASTSADLKVLYWLRHFDILSTGAASIGDSSG